MAGRRPPSLVLVPLISPELIAVDCTLGPRRSLTSKPRIFSARRSHPCVSFPGRISVISVSAFHKHMIQVSYMPVFSYSARLTLYVHVCSIGGCPASAPWDPQSDLR